MPQTPEYRFQDQMLRITAGSEMRLRWSPVPVAEQRVGVGRWMSFTPDFRVLASLADPPDGVGDKAQAFRAFRAEIPDEIARSVEPFPCYQWPLLVLAHKAVAFLDLLQSNPVLGFCLANCSHFRDTHCRTEAEVAAGHCGDRQRDILGWLGFPASDAMVRLMRKVPVEIVHPGLLRKLQSAAASPEVLKVLGHAPLINAGTTYLVANPDVARLVKPALMLEVAQAPDEMLTAPTADMLLDLYAAAREMRQEDRLKPMASCEKVEAVHESVMQRYTQFLATRQRQKDIKTRQDHLKARYVGRIPLIEREMIQRLQAEHNRLAGIRPIARPAQPAPPAAMAPFLGIDQLRTRPFPPPPFDGTDAIQPITSLAELEQEGLAMGNCLAGNLTYASRIVGDELYVYRVLGPERHTLAIVRIAPSVWTISELRGPNNKPALPSAVRLVNAWLDSRQLSMSACRRTPSLLAFLR